MFTDPANNRLLCRNQITEGRFVKYHKWKIDYSLKSLCHSAIQEGMTRLAEVWLGNTFGLDMLRAADES